MKKILFLMAAILVGSMTDVSAQEVNTAPFLTDSLRPNGIDYIAEPPAMTSGAFYDDFYYYQWGKEQRQETTAVRAAKTDSEESAAIYDLQGRRYDSVPSQSSVYVHGQQKILVK